MPTTLVTKQRLERIEQNRTELLALTALKPEQLRVLSDEQLVQLQGQLLMGNTWGKWEVPKEWMSGNRQTEGRRTYRLELALPMGVESDSVVGRRIWRELLRFTLAMRLWPGPTRVVPKPSTIRIIIDVVGRVIRTVDKLDDIGFWSHVTRAKVNQLVGRAGSTYLNAVSYYYKLGALPDAPETTRRKGLQARRDRTDEPEHSTPADESKQWQPFPDTYTAAAGWRAVQMMRLAGPSLLAAFEQASKAPIRTFNTRNGQPLLKSSLWQITKAARDLVIVNWDWRSPDGSPLLALPMTISLRSPGKGPPRGIAWPPKTYAEAAVLMYLLQACHLWIVALALAGRHGEVLSMQEDCLRRETSQTPTGAFPTWKLDGIAGREAEAPLPDIVIATLSQQQLVAKLIKRIHGIENEHLWVQMGLKGGSQAGIRMNSFENSLLFFNKTFSLEPLMENTSLHMHRFRKTLVRIVALALVHAPKILMDILGHRDEQMTVMRYILSDPGILAEIEEVARELVILKGLEAVEKCEDLQGKAAPVFRERVAQYAKLLGRNALEPQNLREFIETMTESGGGWAIIGPGKVCTGFKKGGLCNDGAGEANPHYCSPDCHNQLLFPDYETAESKIESAIVDTIETLDYMVEQLQQSDDSGEVMLVAQFAGQIKGLLHQWREVDQHFRERHLGSPLISRHIDVVLLP